MAVRQRSDDDAPRTRRRPATTPEGRENQLISMAMDLAEDRISSGSASAQEVVHFLRLGSSREKLEQERIRNENQLTQAKIEHMASLQRQEELISDALKAMRGYQGLDQPEQDDIED